MSQPGDKLLAYVRTLEEQRYIALETKRKQAEQALQQAWEPLCAQFLQQVGTPLVLTWSNLNKLPRLHADGMYAPVASWMLELDHNKRPVPPYAPLVAYTAVAEWLVTELPVWRLTQHNK